jgi:hypothetical protein
MAVAPSDDDDDDDEVIQNVPLGFTLRNPEFRP